MLRLRHENDTLFEKYNMSLSGVKKVQEKGDNRRVTSPGQARDMVRSDVARMHAVANNRKHDAHLFAAAHRKHKWAQVSQDICNGKTPNL